MEEEKVLYLTDDYYIRKYGVGYSLSKKVETYSKKLDKMVTSFEQSFYGTLYQTLQGFLLKSINDNMSDDLEKIRNNVLEITDLINSKKEEIKDTFCVYVREC